MCCLFKRVGNKSSVTAKESSCGKPSNDMKLSDGDGFRDNACEIYSASVALSVQSIVIDTTTGKKATVIHRRHKFCQRSLSKLSKQM